MNRRVRRAVAALAVLHALGIGPAAAQLLGSSQSGELFRIDVTDRTTAFIGTMPSGLATEIEFGGAALALYAEEWGGGERLHRIDPATGASMNAVTTTPSGALNGMEFVDDVLYAAVTAVGGGKAPANLFTVDPTTGVLTGVGPTGLGPVSGLAWDGQTMYGVSAGNSGDGSGASALYRIDLTEGWATLVGQIREASGQTFNAVGSIEFGPDGVLYAGISSGGDHLPKWIIAIDKNTGIATPLFETSYSITGLTLLPAPPAPTVAMPSLGVLGSLPLIVLLGVLGLRRPGSRKEER